MERVARGLRIHPAMEQRIRDIVNLHLDPRWGSRYWIEQAQQRGIRADDIRDEEDLALFGAMDEEVLRSRPVADFVPRKLSAKGIRLIRAETGCTTGDPKRTVFTEEEFQRAFIEPYCRVALRMGMARGLEWLYVGPGAPHIIGIASREYCRRLGSNDPFSVGIDARWIRKFPPHSQGFRAYLHHVLAQARGILATQHVSALFTTPPIIESLAAIMTEEERQRIRAIHLGGMLVRGEFLARLREHLFPEAFILPGYGNSLYGVAPALATDDGHIDYYPDGARLVFRFVPADEEVADDVLVAMSVAEGETGRLMVHRFDESCMILNALERDQGVRVPPSRLSRSLGFAGNGLRDPHPIQQFAKPATSGVY